MSLSRFQLKWVSRFEGAVISSNEQLSMVISVSGVAGSGRVEKNRLLVLNLFSVMQSL